MKRKWCTYIATSRLHVHVLNVFPALLQDFKNIKAGLYKLPWDVTTLGNKQFNPLNVLRTAVTSAQEASNSMQRRFRDTPDDVWLQSSMYPDYYLKTFHYQVGMPPLHGIACMLAICLDNIPVAGGLLHCLALHNLGL